LPLLAYRALPIPLSGPLTPWLATLVGVLVALVVVALATGGLGLVSDPDVLLGPIRWDALPQGAA